MQYPSNKGIQTGFRQIESFLEQIGHQPEDGYKTAQSRADDVEIDQGQRRHVAGYCRIPAYAIGS